LEIQTIEKRFQGMARRRGLLADTMIRGIFAPGCIIIFSHRK